MKTDPFTTMIPAAKLFKAPWNANVVPADVMAKLKHSVTEYGVVQNLVVRDMGDIDTTALGDEKPTSVHGGYQVIGGNHRLQIYLELGIDPIPCHVVDVPEPEAMLLSEALNQIHGKDDPDLYNELIRSIVNNGITALDITKILNETEESVKKILGAGTDRTDPVPPAWQNRYELVVELPDEQQQADLYRQLTDDGYTCRVLTM